MRLDRPSCEAVVGTCSPALAGNPSWMGRAVVGSSSFRTGQEDKVADSSTNIQQRYQVVVVVVGSNRRRPAKDLRSAGKSWAGSRGMQCLWMLQLVGMLAVRLPVPAFAGTEEEEMEQVVEGEKRESLSRE